MKKFSLITIPSLLIALLLAFFLWPKHSQQSDFINFNLKDVSQEKLVDFVINDKKVLEAHPEYKDSIIKEKTVMGQNRVAVTFKSSEEAEKFSKDVLIAEGGRALEKDVQVKAFVSFDDPQYSSQSNLSQMDMATGWDYLNDTSSIKIAIIDTGVRGTHEELSGKTLTGYNVLTSSIISAGSNSDDNGHGTAMATIAAATANNTKGIVGVAYNSSIVPIKALNSGGTGLGSDVATGINWAADNGVKIVNLSLGSSDYSQTMHDAIQHAVNHGCVVAAASGNDGGNISYPGRDSLVISVGSVNSNNARSSFSNYGSELDVMAPGESIRVGYYDSDSSYATGTGTSASTAEVSGLAALAVNWHTGASVSDLVSYFRNSAQKIGGLGGSSCNDYYGCGLANYNRLQTVAGDFHHTFVSQSGYPTIAAGLANQFVLTVKNTGKSTWRRGQVNLGTSHDKDRISRFTREGGNPSGWVSKNRIQFQEAVVAPGANAIYSFWMRNDNLNPGTYREYFQLATDGLSWMEDYGIYWDVNVPQPTPAYTHSFVTQNGYPTLAHGQAYKFQVTVKNTGTATWQRGIVNLATSHDRDRIPNFTRESADGNPSGWVSKNRIRFEQTTVAPGANATFSFYMRNDSTPSGTTRQYFQLVADGIGWMEDYGIYWDVRVP